MLCDNIDGDHMDCMTHHYIDHFINHSVDNRQKSTDTPILAYICSVHVCLLMMYP